MYKNKILLKQVYRAFREKIFVIGFLLFVSFVLVFCGLSLFIESDDSVAEEMERVGFGDICVWLTGEPENEIDNLLTNSAVSDVKTQSLIYSDYEINGIYSDNEGQILKPNDAFKYRITDEYGNPLANQEIKEDCIYISPAMIPRFQAKVGDSVTFEMARSNGKKTFQIAGFFSDPFMGSSMIDMKSFLISDKNYEELKSFVTETKEDNRLALAGYMLHISGTMEYRNDLASLQKEISGIYSNSGNIKFSYNRNSIKSYMLMLSNILSGFMLIAGILLFLVTLIITVNVNESIIQKEYKNISSLKTIGIKGKGIAASYVTIWMIMSFISFLISIPFVLGFIRMIPRGLVTSTGIFIPVNLSMILVLLFATIFFMIYTITLYIRCKRIVEMKPVEIAVRHDNNRFIRNKIEYKKIIWCLSVRDFLSGIRHYIGTIIIATVLVLFLGIVGRMGNWLGDDGEGLMNTFSVAEHDLGVQPFNETVPMDEIERVINWYSPVKERYELAMQSVVVNGNEYTANILNDTSYFHLLSGRLCEGKEILITETVASELGISIGDTVTISGNGRHEEYEVSGIYQCANGMGTNIGMDMAGYSLVGDVTGFIWCHHYILENGNMRDYCMKYLQENYKGIDVHTNSWSGLSGIVFMMHMMMIVIYILAAVFVFFAVWLNSRGIMQAESKNIAILKSIGVSERKLRIAFSLRFLIASLIGTVIGTIMAAVCGNKIVLCAFKMIGIGEFQEGISFLGVLMPLMLIPILFFVSAYLLSGKIKKVSILNMIRNM